MPNLLGGILGFSELLLFCKFPSQSVIGSYSIEDKNNDDYKKVVVDVNSI